MLVSLIIFLLLTASGFSLTYLFAKDEPLMWRLGAGNVVGSAVFGLVCFLLACFFGFSTFIVGVSLLIGLAPLLVFSDKSRRARFDADWRKAKGKLEGATAKKFLRFGYYLFFIVLFGVFFERAILVTSDGIFTGASQNYGDLPFHLGAIFSFTEGNNFPPENPSYAFAKFSYPFMADLIAAAAVKLGAGVRAALFVQNVSLAFALLVVMERLAYKMTGNRLAGKIAPVLLFFSGGLGFLVFFKDYWLGAQGFFDFLYNLPQDYTISNKFRWGNSLVVLFITQRSLLLGMPLTIIALQKLWETFSSQPDEETEKREKGKKEKREEGNKAEKFVDEPSFFPFPLFTLSLFPLFIVGLLAGTLPLIHVHSLAMLFVVSAFLFFFRLDKWREWLAFGVGVSVVAVPELIWAMTGSATRLREFIDWNFGWHKGEANFLWFWLINTGIFVPVLIIGSYLIWEKGAKLEERHLSAENNPDLNSKTTSARQPAFIVPRPLALLLFSLPFWLCFFIANSVKLAPWEWDNIKVLIYWFVGTLPIVALVLARFWVKKRIFKIAAVAALLVLTFAGALDIWRTISRKTSYKIFSRDSAAIAEQIKSRTAPNALFLNAPTFNSAVVLTGRRSLMRYSGHLSSYGIDYYARETDVRSIYTGDAAAQALIEKYGIEYILVSPEEKASLSEAGLTVNEEFFRRFPVFAEVGEYRVYKVGN